MNYDESQDIIFLNFCTESFHTVTFDVLKTPPELKYHLPGTCTCTFLQRVHPTTHTEQVNFVLNFWCHIISMVHTSDLGMENMAASISGGATSDVGLSSCFPPDPSALDEVSGGEDPSRLVSGFVSSSAPLLSLSNSLLFMYFLPYINEEMSSK